MTSDGFNYIEISRNILNGKGIVNNNGEIVNHWPPLYPISLAIISQITNLDPFESARYLQAFLLFSTFFVFNLILNRFNLKKVETVLINCFLLLSFALNVYFWIQSEGLFILLLLSLLYLFLKWSDTQKNNLLLISGVFSALLLLTRYAAGGFVLGIGIYLLFFQKKIFFNKLKNIFVFSIGLFPLLILWLVYAHDPTKGSVNREFIFHLIPFRKIMGFIKSLLSWGIPFKNDLVITITALILVAFLLVFLLKLSNWKQFFKHVLNKYREYLLILFSLIICYTLFLFFSISFLDAHTPLDSRIVAPLYPLTLLLFIPYFKNLYDETSFKKHLKLFFGVILILMLTNSIKTWHLNYTIGEGFTSKIFKESNTLQAFTIYNGKKIYTNAIDLMLLYHPELADKLYTVPNWIDPGTNQKLNNVEEQITLLKNDIETNNAIVVYFTNVTWRYYLMDKEEILHRLSGLNVTTYDDGFIINK